jgi:hypothetical protein
MSEVIVCNRRNAGIVRIRIQHSNGSSDIPSLIILSTLLRTLFCIFFGLHAPSWGQTASTGALMGEVLDPSGEGIAHASVEVKNQKMAVSRSTP